MGWEVEWRDDAREWFGGLPADRQRRIESALEPLLSEGPNLGRPLVDRIHHSKHQNMKELRPTNSIRILFAFDPNRRAVMLVGGDKKVDWDRWTDEATKRADRAYDDHLRKIGKGGTWTALRTGTRSAGKSR